MTGTPTWAAPGAAEWVAVLAGIPHDVYHLPAYVGVEARAMGGEARAFVYREGDSVLLLPLVVRPVPGSDHVDAVSPYGYPGPASNVPVGDVDFWARAGAALVDVLAGVRAIACFVRLHPLLPVPTDVLGRYGTVLMHGNTVAIDLTRGLDKLWAQTRTNHRRQVERARRDGLAVGFDDWSRVGVFVEIYHETMRRVGADDYYFFSEQHVRGLRGALGEHVHLALVEDGPDVLAGGIFFEAGGIVQYHLGATRDAALRRQPTKLMFIDVERWAVERGNDVVHLGGGVGGEDNPLFHFKAGFSDWHPEFGTWRVVVDRVAYDDAVARLRPDAVPAGDAGFFPAYRASQ